MDPAQIDAMDPEARMNFLGNSLYPGVVSLAGDAVAGKITGMLLEMENAELLNLIESPDALDSKIKEALEVLAAHRETAGQE